MMRGIIRKRDVLSSLVVALLLFAGCESNSSKDWVTPADINGTWQSEINDTSMVRNVTVMIHQNRSDVSGSYIVYLKSSDGSYRPSTIPYSGTYDLQSGIMTVTLTSHTTYFRFESETVMYEMLAYEMDNPGRRYTKQ